MSVQRHTCNGMIRHDPDGEYVRYKDYAKLLAALKQIASTKFTGWDGDAGVCAIAQDAIYEAEETV